MDPKRFVERLPLMAGCPPSLRARLRQEFDRMRESRAHMVSPEMAPNAYFLMEFLKGVGVFLVGTALREVGKRVYRRVMERMRAEVPGLDTSSLPTLEEALEVAELFRGMLEPRPGRRVAPLDGLALSRVRLTVVPEEMRPLARLALLANSSYLEREEVLELASWLRGEASAMGADPGDFPLVVGLREVMEARGDPAGDPRVHAYPEADPALGALIPYDPGEAAENPSLAARLLPDFPRLCAAIAHEYLGHGFVYSSTRYGRIAARLRAEALSLSGPEGAEAEERLRAFTAPLLVVDEGFALWMELAILSRLSPLVPRGFVEGERMRHLTPPEDPMGRCSGPHFDRVYGGPVNPYREGYSMLLDLERTWGKRFVVEAVKMACSVPDFTEGRSAAEIEFLLRERPGLCPDVRLSAIRAAAVSRRPGTLSDFRRVAQEALAEVSP